MQTINHTMGRMNDDMLGLDSEKVLPDRDDNGDWVNKFPFSEVQVHWFGLFLIAEIKGILHFPC